MVVKKGKFLQESCKISHSMNKPISFLMLQEELVMRSLQSAHLQLIEKYHVLFHNLAKILQILNFKKQRLVVRFNVQKSLLLILRKESLSLLFWSTLFVKLGVEFCLSAFYFKRNSIKDTAELFRAELGTVSGHELNLRNT